MKKEIPELKKLELNKQNVMEILFKCKASNTSSKTITANFYSDKSVRQSPSIQLDSQTLFSYNTLILYWLGQLQVIHQQKDKLTPAAGIINYKGEKWTDDNRALFALYYLATSTLYFPKFEDGPTCAETPSLKNYYKTHLFPTYSPDDPRFKLEDAKLALEDLGVKLPEDLSELD